MSTLNAATLQPRYLPAPFKFQKRVLGTVALGFKSHGADDIAFVYTAGQSNSDWANPLCVYFTAERDAVLTATENRPGVRIEVGPRNTQAIYHDGLWGPSGDGAGPPEWLIGTSHSLTMARPTGTLALRAPRSVSLEDLLRTIASIAVE